MIYVQIFFIAGTLMNAVLRLNLVVTFVFILALCVTLYEMLQQASKDITREVSSGLTFTHLILSAAITDQELLEEVLEGETRHVKLTILDSREPPLINTSHEASLLSEDDDITLEWLVQLIPDIERLADKEYFRYLPDGRVLKLTADVHDELEEVWESVALVLMLFLMGALLSNIAIYIGVRKGIKPITDFLNALNHIGEGNLSARLSEYSIKEINQLSQHFNVMAEAVELAEADNKKLTHELLNLRESERSYLARELHDDLGQYLTGIKAQAYLIKAAADKPEIIAKVGGQIASNCDAMQVSFRQLIQDLHPVILEQLGFIEAINALIDTWQQTHSINVASTFIDEMPEMSDEHNTHLYRIVQESLNNVAQHAGASNVDVTLAIDNSELVLSIHDDGRWSESNTTNTGLGLRSMKERAHCMNGNFQFTHSETEGTTVVLRIPILKEVT